MASFTLTALTSIVIALLCINPVVSYSEVNTSKQLDELIALKRSVFVFIYRTGQLPTKMLDLKLDRVSKAYENDNYVIVKVNADLAADIVNKQGITSTPAFRAYKDRALVSKEDDYSYRTSVDGLLKSIVPI